MLTSYWDPWLLLDEVDHVFDRAEWPQFDIEDTDDDTVLTADVPGMSDDDIEITVQGAYLTVRGERKAKQGRYLRRARFYGGFERRFWLGDTYDPDRIRAHVENGVLMIHLEKAAKAKPRRIKLGGGVVGKVKGLLSGDKDKQDAA